VDTGFYAQRSLRYSDRRPPDRDNSE